MVSHIIKAMNKKKLHRCLLHDIKQQAQAMMDNGCDQFDHLNDLQEGFDEDCAQPTHKLPHHRYTPIIKQTPTRLR